MQQVGSKPKEEIDRFDLDKRESAENDGRLKIGDVLVRVNGKKFRLSAIQEIGIALEESEGSKEGEFTLDVLRGGSPMKLEFNVGNLGHYSKTFPYNCKKSENQYEDICSWLAKEQRADGSWQDGGNYRRKIVTTCVAGLVSSKQLRKV